MAAPYRSPAWTMEGNYVSDIPAIVATVYDPMIGDYREQRTHLFYQPDGVSVRHCKPNLCRECERERSWRVDGETEA